MDRIHAWRRRDNLRDGRRRSYPGPRRKPGLHRHLRFGYARRPAVGFHQNRGPERRHQGRDNQPAPPPLARGRRIYSAGDRRDGRMAIWRAILVRKVAVGRKISKSATSAEIIANALSHPNRRSEGRLEKTVIASPHANTADVRINGGPTRMVARSTPTAGSGSVSSICNRLRK